MKTKHSGILTNILAIHKLANLAKNTFLFKLFYILCMLMGVQFAYAGSSVKNVTISFNFLYGKGIESLYFDRTDMWVENSVAGNFTVTDSSSTTGYTLTVKTDVETGANSITNNFNKESPHMEAGGSDLNASSLDFLFAGVFSINGHVLSNKKQTFTIAHENYKKGNSDWWIADTSGNASLYKSGDSIAMTVQDDTGNYYCLTQTTTNYQIMVNMHSCNTGNIYTGSWQYVGNANFAQALNGNMSLTVGPNDQPIVAYTTNDTTHGIKVLTYSSSNNNGESWIPLDSGSTNPAPYVSEADAYNPSIKFLNVSGYSPEVFVAYQDACTQCTDVSDQDKNKISVKNIDFSNKDGWQYYGNRNFSVRNTTSSGQLSLAFDLTTPYIAYDGYLYHIEDGCNDQWNLYQVPYCIYAMKYNSANNQWEQFGNPIAINGNSFTVFGLAFAGNTGNDPAYVEYTPTNGSTKLTETNSKDNWVSSGNDTSDSTASSSLAIDPSNNAWIAYQDTKQNTITLAEFINGKKDAKDGTWVTYPNPLPEANTSNSYLSMAFDNDPSSNLYSLPIIAYIDSNNSNLASVKYFSGNLWYTIGNPGFPYIGSNYKNTQLAVGQHAIFVAFEDQNGNISVMKYNK